ncbi:SRPBCC family protein [Actinomyces haliotis]|uniref:SRPBCC family protein n=1 Tax=Actinomyces haliotis TaxID=1280843 RepID=UPI001890B009
MHYGRSISRNVSRAVEAARHGRIDAKAPVQATATADIHAPADRVFDALSDLASWPAFIPEVTRIQLDAGLGPLVPGTRFSWCSGGFPLRSEIQRVERGAELTWTGTALWVVAVHRNVVVPTSAEACRLTSAESMAGLGVGWMLRGDVLTDQLKEFVAAIGREAERRAAAGSGHTARPGQQGR